METEKKEEEIRVVTLGLLKTYLLAEQQNVLSFSLSLSPSPPPSPIVSYSSPHPTFSLHLLPGSTEGFFDHFYWVTNRMCTNMSI